VFEFVEVDVAAFHHERNVFALTEQAVDGS